MPNDQIEYLNVKLTSCRGIRSLDHTFNFTKQRTHIVYGSNGIGKTSLAATIYDCVEGQDTLPNDYCTDSDQGRDIALKPDNYKPEDNIVVFSELMDSIDDLVASGSNAITSLLLDQDMRDGDVGTTRKSIMDLEFELNTMLAKNTKRNVDTVVNELSKEIYKDQDGTKSYRETVRLLSEEIPDRLPDGVDYKVVFDSKAIDKLEEEEVVKELEKYCGAYEKALKKAKYLTDKFNHYQASEACEGLQSFFDAKHEVALFNHIGNKKRDKYVSGDFESAKKKWQDIIEQERKDIFGSLESYAHQIEKTMGANRELRELRATIMAHQELIPKLKNVHQFRRNVLADHMQNSFHNLEELLSGYKKYYKALQNAPLDKFRRIWERVEIGFRSRFVNAPFEPHIDFDFDQDNNPTPLLEAAYNDQITIKFKRIDPLSKRRQALAEKQSSSDLVDKLSSGEKKVFKILQYIYVIVSRAQEKIPTILVMDDIVDSFDYENKHAFIQYVMDIHHNKDFSVDQEGQGLDYECFRQIILTHNFDFFRSLSLIPGIKSKGDNCCSWHMARAENKTSLLESKNLTQVSNQILKWLSILESPPKPPSDLCKIATVALLPFARNIAQYSSPKASKKLDPQLHIKEEGSLSVIKLIDIYVKLFRKDLSEFRRMLESQKGSIEDIANEAADAVAAENETLSLRDKLVLSISIRFQAERFIKEEINPKDATSNQTVEWVRSYIENLSAATEVSSEAKDQTREILLGVLRLPAETIHINSFMYEPLIDIPDAQILDLYEKVRSLKPILSAR